MEWTHDGWNIFHLYALHAEGPCKIPWRQFLHLYLRIIPCVECKLHFRKIVLGTNNARRAKQNGTFANSIEIRNRINRRLGKPDFNTLESYKYYQSFTRAEVAQTVKNFDTLLLKYLNDGYFTPQDYLKFTNAVSCLVN